MHKYVITEGEVKGMTGNLERVFELSDARMFLEIEEGDQARVEFCTFFFVLKALFEFTEDMVLKNQERLNDDQDG